MAKTKQPKPSFQDKLDRREARKLAKAKRQAWTRESKAVARNSRTAAKAAAKQAKAKAFQVKMEGKTGLAKETIKQQASVSKHAAWAAAATNALGRTATVAQSAVQNVNGGLTDTQQGRNGSNEDEEDVQSTGDVVSTGGKVGRRA